MTVLYGNGLPHNSNELKKYLPNIPTVYLKNIISKLLLI